MTDLRSYLEEVADNDLAPTVGSMRRSRPRAKPRVKTARRADKNIDLRTDHDVAAELRRLHQIRRITK